MLNNVKSFIHNRIPPQLVIQFTNHCNARCPQCSMRVTSRTPRTCLEQDEIKRIIDAAAMRGVQAISFTGGEPLLFPDALVALIQYAGSAGIPYIRTGTNGFYFRGAEQPDFEDRAKRLVDRLAATPLRNFWISLDSALPEVHEKMRGLRGVITGINKVLPIFHQAGIFPSANLGLNRQVGGIFTAKLDPSGFVNEQDYLDEFYSRFVRALDDFYAFVRQLGFTMASTCYPMSIDTDQALNGLSAVYAAAATDRVVRFSAPEKVMLYKALLNTIVRHRKDLRIFSPLSSIYMLFRQYWDRAGKTAAFGCRGGIDFFFINAADGNTYPCGYRGNENMGKFWDLDLAALKRGRDCHRCDWECFRDPSEVCAPLLKGLHQPIGLLSRWQQNPVYLQYWLSDMRYYHACRWFDGRKAPDSRRLKRFLPNNSKFDRQGLREMPPAAMLVNSPTTT